MAQDNVSYGVALFDALNPAVDEAVEMPKRGRAWRRHQARINKSRDRKNGQRGKWAKDLRESPLVIAARRVAMAEAAEDTIIAANEAAWWRSLSKLSPKQRKYQEFLASLTDRELEEFSGTVMA